MSTVLVTVPQGAAPLSTIQVLLAGQMVGVQIPADKKPGETFPVQAPTQVQMAVVVSQPAVVVQAVQSRGADAKWKGFSSFADNCGTCCCFMCPYGCAQMKVCEIGTMIGTEEAIELTSCKGQIINCCSAIPLISCYICFACPEYWQHNYGTQVLMLASEKLGKIDYPSPFGSEHGPGIQMCSCVTAPCTWCIVHNELSAGKFLPAAPRVPDEGKEWESLTGCCGDPASCVCGFMCPCVSLCLLSNKLDELDAEEWQGFGSTGQQCKNWCSYFGIAFSSLLLCPFACCWCCTGPCILSITLAEIGICPETFQQNYDTNILQKAKKILKMKAYPGPLGLERGPGMQMVQPCTNCLTICLLHREANAALAAMQR